MNLNPSEIALSVVNRIPAIVAYWDVNQICVFSNDAYTEWFGKTPQQMKGMHLKELLGPVYPLNLPHILAVLRGENQVFERQLRFPSGVIKETIATYTPDIVDGLVRGFLVHVTDVTALREREAALEKAIADRDAAQAEVQTLRGLLPICAFCKDIRDESGDWQQMEAYVSKRSEAKFSHGVCPNCIAKHYGDLFPEGDDT